MTPKANCFSRVLSMPTTRAFRCLALLSILLAPLALKAQTAGKQTGIVEITPIGDGLLVAVRR